MRRFVTSLFVIMTAFSTVVLAQPEGQTEDSKPVPLNLRAWFTEGDYPQEERRQEHEGRTVYNVVVSPGGRVESCDIILSSNHSALDDQTCHLISSRARFEPARDADGNAVHGNYQGQINWALTDGDTVLNPVPTSSSFTFIIEIDGSLSGCERRVEIEGVVQDTSDIESPCGQVILSPYLNEDGDPVRKRVTVQSTTTVELVE